MNEALLQFIWQYQYFSKTKLQTTAGEDIEIYSTGILNRHQGPDFLDARIRVGSILWCGPVELHVHSADWHAHGHQSDPHYQQVILHVVWMDNASFDPIHPVLELSGRISKIIEQVYLGWMHQLSRIPCEAEMKRLSLYPSSGWITKLLEERLCRRSEQIHAALEGTQGDWETCFWWQLARSFGHRVNADTFEELAKSLPLSMLSRHRYSVQLLESLLIGQCGLLSIQSTEPYVQLLQREYGFLKHKHKLQPIRSFVKFLRMRPHNFPTVRLAQLAMLLHRIHQPFQQLLCLDSLDEVCHQFTVTANDFWNYHYRLEKKSAYLEKKIGRDMLMGIVINAFVPFLYAYAQYYSVPLFRDRALQWLAEADPEQNANLRVFLQGGQKPASGAETQALLELEREYCSRKRCLDCDVGQRLMSVQQGRQNDLSIPDSVQRATLAVMPIST